MTVRVLLAALVGALTFGCERPAVVSAPPTAQPAATAQRSARDAGTEATRLDRAVVAPAEGVTRCREQVAAGVREVERTPMPARLAPALQLFANACGEPFGGLGEAAKAASQAAARERSELLGRSAVSALSNECSVERMTAPASTIATGCASAQRLQLDESLRRDVDAGTLLFVAAVTERAKALGLYDDKMQRLLETMLLSAALQSGR